MHAADGKGSLPGCYTFSVVEYVKLGRRLGIGTRVAAKILRDRKQNAGSAAATETPAAKPAAPRKEQATVHTDLQSARQQADTRVTSRNVGRGVAQGGKRFWRPFARITRALWHEVTGVFFAIFSLFFFQSAWRVREAWQSGVEHRHFVIYVAIAVLFLYFSVTAFVTAHRHKK